MIDITLLAVIGALALSDVQDEAPSPQSPDSSDCIALASGEVAKVDIEFDVTAKGEVVNVRVIDSTDRCYEEAAVKAASQWRYEPKLVDGKAVPRYGVRTTLVYEPLVAPENSATSDRQGD